MLFMTSLTSGVVHRAMLANQTYFGRFYTPKGKDGVGDLGLWERWCLDNGAFTGYSEALFFDYLERLIPYQSTCQFVIVPDVPFRWDETLGKFGGWHQAIANMGFKRAIAVQDGATVENVPWSQIEAVFIGGSTQWKRDDQFNALPMFKDMTPHPRDQIIAEAKRRGIPVHIGRQANSQKQLWNAYRMGATFADGTGEKHAPKQEFPWIVQTMFDIHRVQETGHGHHMFLGKVKRSRYSQSQLAYSAVFR